MSVDVQTTNALSPTQLEELRSAFAADPSLKRSQNAVTRVGVQEIAVDHDVAAAISSTLSHRLDDWSATNQKKSGRCWLFAALNLLRAGARTRLGVKEFEFSQNYAMYWDKLERANYFLTSMLATADRPLGDRLVSFLLSSPMDDGGQWNMAASLFTKHGVVPKEAMPETYSSSNTAAMNTALRTIVRQGAQRLRTLVAEAATTDQVEAARDEILAQVHRVLTIHLGTPPRSFDWQWIDDEKNFHRDGVLTPQEFFDKYVTVNLQDYVCLVDDPRPEHPEGAMLTVEHLGNVVGGDPVRYLNVDITTAKKAAMDTLVEGEPVWFGCDVGPHLQRQDGVWDANLYDYAGVYNVDFTLSKQDRVRYQESAMTHAMLFTGVDVHDGAPRRWRVENSWGSEVGNDGFFTMTDTWFDEYVFEVLVNVKHLPAELRTALQSEPVVLPAWDPMGALA